MQWRWIQSLADQRCQLGITYQTAIVLSLEIRANVPLLLVFLFITDWCERKVVFPLSTHKPHSLKTTHLSLNHKVSGPIFKEQHNLKSQHTLAKHCKKHFQNPPIYMYPTSNHPYMRNKDIIRFDISMHKIPLMQILQCQQYLIKNSSYLVNPTNLSSHTFIYLRFYNILLWHIIEYLFLELMT